MVPFLVIAGLLEVLFGFGVFTGAKSAIHEILGILALGFAVLTFGLAGILNEMRSDKTAVSGLRVPERAISGKSSLPFLRNIEW